MKAACRFCRVVLGGQPLAQPWDHVLLESENFVVLPSKGSLVPGWLLVVPKAHQLSLAACSSSQATELESIIALCAHAVERTFGPATMFEHGAVNEGTSWGCGIDHAHAHVLHLPFDLSESIATHESQSWVNHISVAQAGGWTANHPYFSIKTPGQRNWSVIMPDSIPRQFARQLIAGELGVPEQFDYDSHPFVANAEKTRTTLHRFMVNSPKRIGPSPAP